MLVSTEKMLADATARHFAIPAPDFWDIRSCRNFTDVAGRLKKPLILSFAEVHISMLSVEEAALLGTFYARKCEAPVALHLDHGVSFEVIESAVESGFTSVMMDASSEPFEENVRKTKEAVKLAHAKGVMVEAEIGHVGVNEGDSARKAQDSIYTEVEDARKFVKETGVDSLAVSIGTSHGLYQGTPVISFERLRELREAVEIPLVLHGGSSTGDENLSRCAKGGIAKINLYTDFIVAALRSVKEKDPEDWPKLLNVSDEAVAGVLEHYYHVFGC